MDLRSNQIKDTYGNLLTVGTSAGSPTTGTVENGQGSDITDLTVNGTLNATDVNATNLGGYGTDISGIPSVQILGGIQSVPADTNYYPSYTGVSTFPIIDIGNNQIINPTDVFELINSGVSGINGSRLQIKKTGIYLVNMITDLSNLATDKVVTVQLMNSFNTTGLFNAELLLRHKISTGNSLDATVTMTHMLQVPTVPESGYYISKSIKVEGDSVQLDKSLIQVMRLSPRQV